MRDYMSIFKAIASDANAGLGIHHIQNTASELPVFQETVPLKSKLWPILLTETRRRMHNLEDEGMTYSCGFLSQGRHMLSICSSGCGNSGGHSACTECATCCGACRNSLFRSSATLKNKFSFKARFPHQTLNPKPYLCITHDRSSFLQYIHQKTATSCKLHMMVMILRCEGEGRSKMHAYHGERRLCRSRGAWWAASWSRQERESRFAG